MPRGIPVLNPAQEQAARDLERTDAQYRETRRTIDEELAIEKAERMSKVKMAKALAVVRALQLGVSRSEVKRRIGNKSELNLRELEHLASGDESVKRPNPFHWVNKDTLSVGVRYVDFPTTSSASDYPAMLEGVLTRDDGAPNGWRVVSDASDIETEHGLVGGLLRWEVERPNDIENHILRHLGEWIETNK